LSQRKVPSVRAVLVADLLQPGLEGGLLLEVFEDLFLVGVGTEDSKIVRSIVSTGETARWRLP
jgi:hypothetical protein